MHSKKHFLKFWFPVIIYAIIIFWVSSQQQPFGVEIEIVGLDKILHIIEYAILGFLLARAFAGSSEKISIRDLVLITFIIGTLYGLTDEFHQHFTPGRVVSILDLISDAISSFLGAVIFKALRKSPSGREHGPLNG